METEVVDAKRLRFFKPFHALSDKQLDYISVNTQVLNLPKGKVILELNSDSKDKFLLLEGRLKLTAFDDSEMVLEAGTERAQSPVAQLRPSRYKVTTEAPSKILVLKEDFMDTAIEQSETSAYSINETQLDEEHEEDRVLYELILELQKGNFVLPSMPSIATRIREVVADENSSAVDIANVILTDPAIAAKIISAEKKPRI